jgi:hypothetical protein
MLSGGGHAGAQGSPPPATNSEPPRDERPLSPAQKALFETPHLANITRPETLQYRFERAGPDALVDTVAVHIDRIHPDGTKYASFDFLSGDRRVFFPAVDQFRGNPLIMAFLEHDVTGMKNQVGLAAGFFRTRIREAFVDRARLSDISVEIAGRAVPARQVTLKPFADDPRLEKLPAIRAKLYSFVLSDAVPGQIVELSAAMPADPESGLPARSETIQFVAAQP